MASATACSPSGRSARISSHAARPTCSSESGSSGWWRHWRLLSCSAGWHLGWWLGHGFEVIGVFLVGVPVALDLRRGAQSRPLSGDLRAAELVASEESFLGSQVRSLMVALAEKDVYTEEHTRRVAMRAVQVGEELELTPARLRSLAIGGLLHDIGKLSVSEEILKKPAALTDDEFGVIQEHPVRGARLLRAPWIRRRRLASGPRPP
ncbi:MAG: HD-GYP domain-containing protein [Gaiellaceae bacterium]